MWNEVWGSHIVTADVQMRKHNYSAYASLQCECVHVCVCVCVFVPCIWWSLKMVCDMWKAGAVNHIACSSNYILLFSFCHVPQNTFHTWGCSHLPVNMEFHFLTASIWFGPQMWRREEREGERGLLIFFESECRSIICFLEGVVVQKQQAGEPCLLYLIGTVSVTPWLKTQWKHYTHTRARTHTQSMSATTLSKPFLWFIHTLRWKLITLAVHRKRHCCHITNIF